MKELKPFNISFSGINLIEASAGTGKTYNITSLYIRALTELDIPVSKILVVTYTEAATKELKDRLLSRIRQAIGVLKKGKVQDENDQFLIELLEHTSDHQQATSRLDQAIRSFDDSAIYTIHGFCYQVLQEQAFESRAMYEAEMIGDDSELVLEAVDDYWRNWVAEVSDNPKKRPLLKLLMDKGYQPESLASELGPYLGKPYLQVLPSKQVDLDLDGRLEKVYEMYQELKELWEAERGEVFSLLDSGHLSYYRTDWIEGWMQQMDDTLNVVAPPIYLFDKFERFTQSYINDSLKKSSQKKGVAPPEHPFFDKAEAYYEEVEPLKNYEVVFKKELYSHLCDKLKQKKEELQVLSYDDLLLRLRNALIEGERNKNLAQKLREKYPIAMVDEFQDTDPNQYDIFRKVYKDSDAALFMIGDPKQSIYSFRGADVFSYLKAKRDAPQEHIYDLGRNFRSVPDLIKGLNTLFGGHENPFILSQIPYEKVTPGRKGESYDSLIEYGDKYPPIRFLQLPLEDREQFGKMEAAEMVVEDTADEICRLIEDGKSEAVTIGGDGVKAKDIAVLVRTHKQASLIANALRNKGIKSVQYSQESVFDSEEARLINLLLQAVVEPTNESLIKAALAQPLMAYTADDIYEIEDQDNRWLSILNQFDNWHKMWQEKGFSAMFRSLLTEANIAEHVINYNDGERRLTNLLHIGELLQQKSNNGKSGMRGLLKWLAKKREEEKGQRQEEEQLRLESDQELVKIVTMHRSKGLEYPIVFCPFLWYGPKYSDHGKPLVYHDPEALDKTYLDLKGKADDERDLKRLLVAKEELAESLRLAYVAMTRAEHCCYLSWAYAQKSEFSPLGYLFLNPEQADDLLTQTISKKYQAIGSVPFQNAIKQLTENYPELFTMESPVNPENVQSDLFRGETFPTFEARTFGRNTSLSTSYQVSSFSSLSSWMEEEDPDRPDYDQFMDYSENEDPLTDEVEKSSIFTFPKGPEPGTCIHNIFEEYYSKSNDKAEVIRNQLELNGIDLQWQETVSKMVHRVLGKSLTDDTNFTLSAVQDHQIPEMEFHYGNDEIQTQQLLSLIRKGALPHWEQKGGAASGFLKGFIDLTFKYNDQYYLLDYKTNYLGNNVDDYREELLQHEMQEASYDLQYHIYTVALHRYLNKRLPEYSYDKHFGGAFYLFLRGINDQGPEGIFFDRPEKETIIKLDQYIGGR